MADGRSPRLARGFLLGTDWARRQVCHGQLLPPWAHTGISGNGTDAVVQSAWDGEAERVVLRPVGLCGSALLRIVGLTVLLALLAAMVLFGAAPARADLAGPDGGDLFANHCAGCHVNGGNIIRRGKTLRLAALERNGIHDAQRIAAIAAAGLGQMSGYGAVLGEGGPEAVADYVWQQAQLDWPQA